MASASLFGSYAKGQVDADSDIDVILFGKPGFRTLAAAVAEELHRSTGKRVDVYEQSELEPGPFFERACGFSALMALLCVGWPAELE